MFLMPCWPISWGIDWGFSCPLSCLFFDLISPFLQYLSRAQVEVFYVQKLLTYIMKLDIGYPDIFQCWVVLWFWLLITTGSKHWYISRDTFTLIMYLWWHLRYMNMQEKQDLTTILLVNYQVNTSYMCTSISSGHFSAGTTKGTS